MKQANHVACYMRQPPAPSDMRVRIGTHMIDDRVHRRRIRRPIPIHPRIDVKQKHWIVVDRPAEHDTVDVTQMLECFIKRLNTAIDPNEMTSDFAASDDRHDHSPTAEYRGFPLEKAL